MSGTITEQINLALDTKTRIKEAIKSKGVEVSESDTFASYPKKIDEIDEWKPESDWWDIDTILAEDTEDYPGKMIALLSDSFPTETINRLNAGKIVISDGTVYTDTSQSIEHTWNTSKDKTCHYGYKTRYVIWYFSKTNVTLNARLPDETMYMIMKNLNYTTSYQSSSNSLYNCRGIQSLKFINCSCLNKSLLYDFTNCCLNNLQGLKYQNSIAVEGLRKIASIIIYNSKMAKSLSNDLYSSLETKKPNSARELFRGVSINYIPFFDTSECNDFYYAFASTGALRSIENIDFNSATSVDRTFENTFGLININSISNIKISRLNFDTSNLLNHDTVIRILNALYNYSDVEETYTITLREYKFSKINRRGDCDSNGKGVDISMSITKTTKQYLEKFNGEEVEKTIVDNMEYAIESKNLIKDKLIKKGVQIDETTKFRDYAEKIDEIDEWKPQPDWWDIKSIVEVDSQPKIIVLCTDPIAKGQIKLLKAEKILLSDGQEFTSDSDFEVQENGMKECSKGYKTWYAVFYFTKESPVVNISYDNWLKFFPSMLYMYYYNIEEIKCNSSWNLCSNGINVEAIESNIPLKIVGNMTNSISNAYNLHKIPTFSEFGRDGANYSYAAILNVDNAPHIKKQQIIDAITHRAEGEEDVQGTLGNISLTFLEESIDFEKDFGFNLKNINKLQTLNGPYEIEALDFENVTQTTARGCGVYNIKKISNIKNDTSWFSCTGTSQYSFRINHATLVRVVNALFNYSNVEDVHTLTLRKYKFSKIDRRRNRNRNGKKLDCSIKEKEEKNYES